MEVALARSVWIFPVPRQSCPVRLPAQDGGEAVVPVVEGQVPPPVVNTLEAVVSLVHRELSEHAQLLSAPSLHVLGALQDGNFIFLNKIFLSLRRKIMNCYDIKL